MTQSTYYLTNHPNSPERRKSLYGTPKPREWLADADKILALEEPKPRYEKKKDFTWEQVKIKNNKTGQVYSGINEAITDVRLTYETIRYHCRKPDGNFSVIDHEIDMLKSPSRYSIKDLQTGKIYKFGRDCAKELGITEKALYANKKRFVRLVQ